MLATTPCIQTLSRFVPFEVLAQLEKQGNQPISPRSDTFAGTVLFADISGFTSLSERLGKRGAVGVEELTQTLNTYFGELIDIVISFGGDIVKFAGDALLAIWRVENDDIAKTVHAAAQCGITAQQCLR
ncbi:MAG: adenylate/guanylate cyclase domain-containing protein, partial [Planctomycetaceae bacterium]|nr:adenylate/guanylate cyclase domain-containing protein [Planctomycetaceae bacterium]